MEHQAGEKRERRGISQSIPQRHEIKTNLSRYRSRRGLRLRVMTAIVGVRINCACALYCFRVAVWSRSKARLLDRRQGRCRLFDLPCSWECVVIS